MLLYYIASVLTRDSDWMIDGGGWSDHVTRVFLNYATVKKDHLPPSFQHSLFNLRRVVLSNLINRFLMAVKYPILLGCSYSFTSTPGCFFRCEYIDCRTRAGGQVQFEDIFPLCSREPPSPR
jgi:hypothetical protein